MYNQSLLYCPGSGSIHVDVCVGSKGLTVDVIHISKINLLLRGIELQHIHCVWIGESIIKDMNCGLKVRLNNSILETNIIVELVSF